MVSETGVIYSALDKSHLPSFVSLEESNQKWALAIFGEMRPGNDLCRQDTFPIHGLSKKSKVREFRLPGINILS